MSEPGGDDVPRSGAWSVRRWIGMGLLIGVLMVFLGVAAVRGRVIAGHPTSPPVGAAPVVGDCLTENPYDQVADFYVLPTVLANLTTERCSGPRYGEVAAVDLGQPNVAGPDQIVEQCHQLVDEYLGIPLRLVLDPSGPAAPANAAFRPTADVPVAVIGPDTRQRAAGQEWTACVAYLPISVDTRTSVTVDHSLRDAWNSRADGALFAICLDDPAARVGADCRVPHRFEQVGMEWGTRDIPQDAWDAACRSIAVLALGSSAALDRGELSTTVVAVRPDPGRYGRLITGPAAITGDADYFNSCLITPAESARQLTAPLRGLGDAPAPLN